METGLLIRAARSDDSDVAADLAVAKRVEYEQYSPVFWRRAPDDRAKHQPFLRQCVESADYAAFAADRDGTTVGVILGNRRGAPPPFHADPEPTWFVDDFYVARAERWTSVGRQLLEAVVVDARGAGAERLIVVTAQRDHAKRSFLLSAGYEVAALWWVHPVVPMDSPLPDLGKVQAVVGPAPPVYEPGGLTALALSIGGAADIQRFDRWAAASRAVLAIVPARTDDTELSSALERNGYTPASEWFVRRL